ncbi:MAG: hypothetical protein RJA07_279 [Bacteroidota bacterium]|jgi:hypothetical protein
MLNNKAELFCCIRKKYVSITPEELVRQQLIYFLVDEIKIPSAKIAVEKQIDVNGLKKRFDILVYNNDSKPMILAECKAPQIKLTSDVFSQIANYNLTLQVKYLLVCNGIDIHFFNINFEEKQFHEHSFIPEYSSL